jgi:hypothetical protein
MTTPVHPAPARALPALRPGLPLLAALAALAALGPARAAEPPAAAAAPPSMTPTAAPAPGDDRVIRIDARAFQYVKDESGPVNYYTVVEDPEGNYIHGAYAPPAETAVLGWAVPEKLRHAVSRVRWRWRAITLPVGGNECVSGKNDSAGVVYLTFKRGWSWYSLKYVWSSVAPRGVTCDKRRNVLSAQDTVIVESGGPLERWRTVELDLEAEFRRHFEKEHRSEERPEFMGIGIMSDGDQTHSPSAADFGGFVVTLR